MKKPVKPDGEKKKKKSDFKEFLKKRAPIYLGLIGLFIIFVVPELTQSNLQNSLPRDFSPEEQKTIDILFEYDGDNNKGLKLFDAISNKINSEYPDEKIYDHKETQIQLFVKNSESTPESFSEIHLIFTTYKENIEYIWYVNSSTEEIRPANLEAKNILGIVDYYD